MGQPSRNGIRQQPCAGPLPVAAPALPTTTIYRRATGIPLLPDVRLLGHPLQQQLRQLVPAPSGVRPRFPLMGGPGGMAATAHRPSAPPPSQCLGGRPPKTGGRKQRSTRATRPPTGAGDASSHQQQSTSASQQPSGNSGPRSHILEVEGLPEGLKPQEAERFLEPLVAMGARLQFVRGPAGQPQQQCGAQVLAVFDSPSAAQGALVAGPKIPKIRLRPLSSSSAMPRPPS